MQRRTFALIGCAAGVIAACVSNTGSPSANAAPGLPRTLEAPSGVLKTGDQTIIKRSRNSSAGISQSGGANSTATITQNGSTTTMTDGVVREDPLPDDEDRAAIACEDADADIEASKEADTGELPEVDADLDGRTASARVDAMRRDAIRTLENQSGLDLRGRFPTER